ncbi:MAG: sulfurtransferase TusA family protein [Alphaproteobacteria bacterium]
MGESEREGGGGSAATTRVLDVKGLACPLPVLRAKKAMRDVPAGEVLEVLATDPGAVKDFEAFCKVTGHTLVDCRDDAGVFRFRIRKKG